MGTQSQSQNEKSLQFIWSWYEDQKEALRDYKNKIVFLITNNAGSLNTNKFSTFSLDEVNRYFEESEEELEHLVCFDLISATEAHLRLDFDKKVSKKDKSNLGRAFRNISNINGDKISLENDIIEQWKICVSNKKTHFSNFIGLLKYRHWLAHGRYWVPKLGQPYDPYNTYSIVEEIFNIVK